MFCRRDLLEVLGPLAATADDGDVQLVVRAARSSGTGIRSRPRPASPAPPRPASNSRRFKERFIGQLPFLVSRLQGDCHDTSSSLSHKEPACHRCRLDRPASGSAPEATPGRAGRLRGYRGAACIDVVDDFIDVLRQVADLLVHLVLEDVLVPSQGMSFPVRSRRQPP